MTNLARFVVLLAMFLLVSVEISPLLGPVGLFDQYQTESLQSPEDEGRLQVLIASPDPRRVKSHFINNVSRDIVEQLHFTLVGARNASEVPHLGAYDLAIMPVAFLEPGFGKTVLPQLLDLTEYRIQLVDAGFIYVEYDSKVIGARLPWDDSHFIAVSRFTEHEDEALALLGIYKR